MKRAATGEGRRFVERAGRDEKGLRYATLKGKKGARKGKNVAMN